MQELNKVSKIQAPPQKFRTRKLKNTIHQLLHSSRSLSRFRDLVDAT